MPPPMSNFFFMYEKMNVLAPSRRYVLHIINAQGKRIRFVRLNDCYAL